MSRDTLGDLTVTAREGDAMATKIETIEDHILQAGEKLRDLAEIHLPAIEQFISELGSNPLVTAFGSVLPAGVSEEAMAILNGIAPILAALGKKAAAPADPTASPSPESAPSSAAPATDTPIFDTLGGGDKL